MAASLAQNTFYLTLATIGQKIIAFLYFAMIARVMGAENTGSYFLALAIVTVVMVLDDLGVTSVLIRETAKNVKEAVIWCRTAMGIKLITMPITVVIVFFVPVLLGHDADTAFLVRIATLIMLADTMSLTFYGVLRGLQSLKYEALGVFVGMCAIATFGGALLVTGNATLPFLIGAMTIGSMWNVCFSASRVVKRLGWGALVPTWKLGWKPLKMAFAFFLAAAFVKIYSYVDSIILSMQLGNEAVGVYSVAYKLTYAFQFFPLAFIGALYPAMSQSAHDPNRLKKIFLDSLWYMMLLGCPIMFGVWSIAPEIIVAFYGTEYIGSILPLQVLIFVLIFIFLDFPIGSLLNATNRQSIKTGIMGGTMVINVASNLILIPRYDVLGACIAAVISFVFMFGAGWYFTKRVFTITVSEVLERIGGIFAASLCMTAVVLFVKPLLHFSLAIPLGAIVYISLLFAFKAISPEHIKILKRVLRKSDYVPQDPPAEL